MRVPVVLPVVHVDVDPAGSICVDIDDAPYNSDHPLQRAHLRALLDQVTTELGSPVRVEVHEHDGTTYADIVTPRSDRQAPGQAAEPDEVELPSTASITELSVAGFEAGEELTLAYVVARPHADDYGTVSLHVPPALLAANRGALFLLGSSSGTIATLT